MMWLLAAAVALLAVPAVADDSDSNGGPRPPPPLPPQQCAEEKGRCKTVSFVRHAQGTHNKAEEETLLQPPDQILLVQNSERKYWDAPLTALGRHQSLRRRQQLIDDNILAPPAEQTENEGATALQLVVTSTLRRAIQTAIHIFGPADQDGAPKFLATELCRERVANFTCDGRSTRAELKKLYSFVDFSELQTDMDLMWLQKEDADGERACRDRAKAFVRWLLARPEEHIAVVSHGHFLRHLFSLLPDEQLLAGAGTEHQGTSRRSKLANAEVRRAMVCAGDGGVDGAPSAWRGLPDNSKPKRRVFSTSPVKF